MNIIYNFIISIIFINWSINSFRLTPETILIFSYSIEIKFAKFLYSLTEIIYFLTLFIDFECSRKLWYT